MPQLTRVTPVRFFALAFILSWGVWIPLDLAHAGVEPFVALDGPSPLLRLFGVLMPAVAAIVLSIRSGGRAELGRLLGRLLLWRFAARWWLAAVAVQPVLLGASALGASLLAGRPAVAPVGLDASALAVSVAFLVVAVLGEEIGWHGVGLPSLQQRHAVPWSALVLGLLLATWHLPFWLLLDPLDTFGPGYVVLNYVFIVPLAFYTTWFFNGAQFSILLPVAFHLAFNIVNTALLPVTEDLTAFALLIAGEWVLAILVLPLLPRQVLGLTTP